MNTNLLLAFACQKQAFEYIQKAEKELYLDDAVTENEAAIMALQNAIDAVEFAFSGILDDIQAEYQGTSQKPIVEMINPYIGVVR